MSVYLEPQKVQLGVRRKKSLQRYNRIGRPRSLVEDHDDKVHCFSSQWPLLQSERPLYDL